MNINEIPIVGQRRPQPPRAPWMLGCNVRLVIFDCIDAAAPEKTEAGLIVPPAERVHPFEADYKALGFPMEPGNLYFAVAVLSAYGRAVQLRSIPATLADLPTKVIPEFLAAAGTVYGRLLSQMTDSGEPQSEGEDAAPPVSVEKPDPQPPTSAGPDLRVLPDPEPAGAPTPDEPDMGTGSAEEDLRS